MARKKSKTLTELELAIMQVIWGRNEASVDDILQSLAKEGRTLSPPSVRTMLGILQDKGYVARRPVGRAYLYTAVVKAEDARTSMVKDLMDRAFDGSATSLVAMILNRDMVSKKELDQVKRLIEEHEQEDKS